MTEKTKEVVRFDERRYESRDEKAVYMVCGESGDTEWNYRKWQVAAFSEPSKAAEFASKLNKFLLDNSIHFTQNKMMEYEFDNEDMKNPDDKEMNIAILCGADYFVEVYPLR